MADKNFEGVTEYGLKQKKRAEEIAKSGQFYDADDAINEIVDSIVKKVEEEGMTISEAIKPHIPSKDSVESGYTNIIGRLQARGYEVELDPKK